MPTASKLVAALAFAILGWLAANAYVPGLPEGTRIGWFREMTAALGAIIGWLVMGPLTGRGYRAAVGSGLRTAVTLVFWAVLGFSIYEMVLMSMKMRYDGPMEAVLGTFTIMLDYGNLLLRAEVLGVLAAGGILGGLVAEVAGRRWS